MTYLGPPGSRQCCKIGNQIMGATNLGGLSEGLVFADKVGLDVSKYLLTVSPGVAGSKNMDLLGARVISRDFAPGGFADYMVKNLGMAFQGVEEMGFLCPGLVCIPNFICLRRPMEMGGWVLMPLLLPFRGLVTIVCLPRRLLSNNCNYNSLPSGGINCALFFEVGNYYLNAKY